MAAAQACGWGFGINPKDCGQSFAATETCTPTYLQPLCDADAGNDITHIKTFAKRDGDNWVINGAKRWIGNGSISDVTIIWARDEADNQVKGFIVPTSTPGYSAKRIEGKQALRIVQNADIVLTDVVVPESNRLQKSQSFRETAAVLRLR